MCRFFYFFVHRVADFLVLLLPAECGCYGILYVHTESKRENRKRYMESGKNLSMHHHLVRVGNTFSGLLQKKSTTATMTANGKKEIFTTRVNMEKYKLPIECTQPGEQWATKWVLVCTLCVQCRHIQLYVKMGKIIYIVETGPEIGKWKEMWLRKSIVREKSNANIANSVHVS